MDEELIQAQAMAARIVCLRMTAQHLKTLHDSVDQASRLPARSQWDRKAAAHAEIFSLLAAAADPVPSEALHVAADLVHDLMLAVGPAAGGMIASSRRRLLAQKSCTHRACLRQFHAQVTNIVAIHGFGKARHGGLADTGFFR